MFKDVTEKLDNFEREQRKAALTVFAIHKPRIFERGINANGGKIGEYKDGPYKAMRAKRGRETAFVNLEMFGSMKKDYQPTKVGVVGYGFSNQKESDKADFNEERYGLIFELTPEEAALYAQLLSDQIFGKK
jgi:hypothetical protein